MEEIPLNRMADLMFLARGCGLPADDAAYLAVAARRGIPLATQDVRLRDVASNAGGELF